jgi:hypothetical protein
MKSSLSYEELIEAGRPRLAELQRYADYLPAKTPEAKADFSRHVNFLEACIRQTYEHVARLARRAESLDEVVQIWHGMSLFCQSALKVLNALKMKSSECGVGQLYDLILDYKLACEKRHNDALEEKECLTMDFPKGVLPELK